MFMDDLKLYAAGINQLNSILEIVMQFKTSKSSLGLKNTRL